MGKEKAYVGSLDIFFSRCLAMPGNKEGTKTGGEVQDKIGKT